MINKKFIYAPLSWALLVLWLLPGMLPVWGAASPANIQPQANQSDLQIQDQRGGIVLTWQVVGGQPQNVAAATEDAALQNLPTVRYGGYQLPMQLETVLLDDAAPVTPQIQQLESIAWMKPLQIAPPLLSAIGDDEQARAPLPP